MMEERKEVADVKCTRCKCYRYPSDFLNDKGRQMKTCIKCREICKKSREKYKCPHGRRKDRCKECNGVGICEHDKLIYQCKPCMTHDERIKYIIRGMVMHSRKKDKKIDKYDADNFIDKCFLEGLFDDNTTCYYCKEPFTYCERVDTFVTLDRLDNTKGHIKSNCVLACNKCNCKGGKDAHLNNLVIKLQNQNNELQNQIDELQNQIDDLTTPKSQNV